MGRRKAAVILVMVILAFAGSMLARGIGKAQRNPEPGSVEEEAIDIRMLRPDERESTKDMEPVLVSMSQEEKSRIRETVLQAVEGCGDIYQSVDKGSADNVVLKEEDRHRLTDCLAGQGYASSCSSNDYNMRGAEALDEVLRQAELGKSVSTEFFTVTKSGTFEWRRLEFDAGELVMTYASAEWEKGRDPNISYI